MSFQIDIADFSTPSYEKKAQSSTPKLKVLAL